MKATALFLVGSSLVRAAEAEDSGSTFDINADWVSWDDTTWTLKSTKPLPGIFTAWSPQTNGYDMLMHTLLCAYGLMLSLG